ncbi:MAG TPA: glycosyltransferase, partial [Lachnospiraceae bacterium]|nr:glycosyltransferase [Lachnospiraceae bacterium]
STYIGYCNDMLALNSICDLYVNPHRMGGGFSIIEAFHEGVPGVTMDYGDVATAAGEGFCVNDYEDMVDTIKKYMEDREFYHYMSERAKERAVLMTDSISAMEEIICKAERSKYFF